MLIKKHHSFTVFCSVFFYTTTALAELSVFSRSFSEDGQFYNTLITGKAFEKTLKKTLKPDDRPNNAQVFELSWSRVTEGEQLQICFPSDWSIPEQAMGLEVLYPNASQQEKTGCKHLIFNESGGQQRVLVAAPDDQEESVHPTFYGSDFSGIVALRPTVESQSKNVRLQQPALPQNKTQFLTMPADSPASGELFAGSSGGQEMYDPFDKKRPPFPFLPNVKSEIVLSLITSLWGERSYIRVNILLATGESFRVTLSGDEALALKKARALMNHRLLISYLRRRQHWLGSWFNQRDNLEGVLDGINPDPDTRYIQNLIDDLNDMTVVITPDDPENGSMPVSGILNAMAGWEASASSQGAGETGGGQASSAPNGLRHRKPGTQGSRQNPNDNGDGADGKKPEQTGGAEKSDTIPGINIRSILEASEFSELFKKQADFILTGLYVYGQLTAGQLMELLDYDAVDGSYKLDSPITSDRVIDILETADEASKIRSLQVVHALTRMLPDTFRKKYHGKILIYTPENLVDLVRNTPDIPADNIPEEICRLLTNELAKVLLDNVPELEAMRRANDLLRSDFMPKNLVRKKFLREYPLTLFVITNHGVTQAESSGPMDFIGRFPSDMMTVSERLQELLGYNAQHEGLNDELPSIADNTGPVKEEPVTEEPVTEELVTEELVTEEPVNTDSGEVLSNEELQQRIKEIISYLKNNKITEETIDLINQNGLFDEARIKKICIRQGRNLAIVIAEAHQLLKDFNNQQSAMMAYDVLGQANYSEKAIKYLRENGYLSPETCELLVKACDEKLAAGVARQLTHKYQIFNAVLASQKIGFPKLIDRLRTTEQWDHIDRQNAECLQNKEIIDTHQLNGYVLRVAQRMANPEDDPYPEDLDADIEDKAKRSINQHDRQLEALTDENVHMSITEAIKSMAKLKMMEIKKNNAERQRRIDAGEESWCEWLTRILLGS